MKTVVQRLKEPFGPLSEEFIPYEPQNKPVLCYEQLLFLIGSLATALTKIVITFNKNASIVTPLRGISLGIILLVTLIACFNLLVPPRLSATRIFFIGINLIWLLMLTSQNG